MNLPNESGGILGGRDGVIMGVYPVFNYAELSKAHQQFSLSLDDLASGQKFLKQYDLEYFGTYHSHPRGAPKPSKQDLKHQNIYLMIVGLRNPQEPVVNIYYSEKGVGIEQEIKLIRDDDIYLYAPTNGRREDQEQLQQNDMYNQISLMINGFSAQYQKERPLRLGSSFSVKA